MPAPAGACPCVMAGSRCSASKGDVLLLITAHAAGYGLFERSCQECAVDRCSVCDGDASVCQACAYSRHGVSTLVGTVCVYSPC